MPGYERGLVVEGARHRLYVGSKQGGRVVVDESLSERGGARVEETAAVAASMIIVDLTRAEGGCGPASNTYTSSVLRAST